VTRSSEGLKSISLYAQKTSRRYWRKSAPPFGFPVGECPKPNRACPMNEHRAAPVSTPDHGANRETELTQLIPKEVIFDSFDRLFASAGKARSTPWSIDHKWGVTLPSGPKKPGFAGPNPPIGVVAALARYSGIALRTASSRINGFGTIKRVKDYFLWYKIRQALA